jgi:hypothetical protein
MIKLSRTVDYDLIRRIITHPRLYPSIASDFHPAPKDFRPNESPAINYMLVTQESDILGLFIAHWVISPLTWECHHAILPSAWRFTGEIAAAAEHWLWTETPCRTAIGHTPACNKLACRYALKHGMKEAGRIPSGYQKAGVLYDLLLLAKERPLCYNV